MDNSPPSFRWFRDEADAVAFAREHAGTCWLPGETDNEPSYKRTAADLLGLQGALESGWRVRIEPDHDTDTSWDETGETQEKLDSGEYESVGVILERCDTWTNERTGETREDWTMIASVWGVIGPANDPYWQIVASELWSEYGDNRNRPTT